MLPLRGSTGEIETDRWICPAENVNFLSGLLARFVASVPHTGERGADRLGARV